MSAAERPLWRGALVVAGGAGFLVLAPIGAALIVAGGWVPTLAGAALSWGVVWRLAKAQDGAWVR